MGEREKQKKDVEERGFGRDKGKNSQITGKRAFLGYLENNAKKNNRRAQKENQCNEHKKEGFR